MKKIEMLCNEYRENKRMIEELQAINDGLKNDIIVLMGDNDTIIEGATKVTNKIVFSTRLDSTAIKKELPEVFNRYSKETSYKRFIVV